MTRVAPPKRRWETALVVAALAAGGVGAGVVFSNGAAEERPDAAAFVADASEDVRASQTKPKQPGKKKTGRGGKTQVAGHRGGAGGGPGAGRGGEEGVVEHAGLGGGAPAGPSYESALDSNNQQVTMGVNAGPDLTDAQLSEPMSDGAFVSDCGAPDSMSVSVKVAITMGRAVGVSVYTRPPSADVASCIDRHVRGLAWPASPKMDSFVTTY